MPETSAHENQEFQEERWELLRQIDEMADMPLTALSFVWLILLIIDLTEGLNPLLQTATYIIWALFILDFLLGVTIAPHKRSYLRRHWLTAVALLLPALRILRIFRAFRILRAARGIRSVNMVRLVTTLNRGMRAIRSTLGRRGIGYVIALTLIIAFAGAAGVYFFEGPPRADVGAGVDNGGIDSYGDALWFTMMLMTTLGSEYWPMTGEGRLLTFFISLYALGVFGYIAGTIASLFVDPERMARATSGVEETGEMSDLTSEIVSLRRQLAQLSARLESESGS